MNRYNDTSKKIVDDFIFTTFPRYLDYVRNGHSDLISIWATEDWDKLLHVALESEWNNLYDVEENPYWRLENITPQDKSLAFQKLKKTVEATLPEIYENKLSNHIDQMTSEGSKMWITFANQVQKTLGTISAADIWNLRNQLDRLFLHYTSLEKARLISNFHSISAEAAPFTTEMDTVDLVPIRTSDLIAASLTSPTPEVNEPDLNFRSTDTEAIGDQTDPLKEQALSESDSHTKKQEGNDDITLEIFTFHRKLKGGVVIDFPPAGTFIPEGEIRKKNFEHGDKLRLVKTYPGNSMTPARHIFEVEEKIALPQPNRVQYNNCILEKEGQIWYVEQYEPFKNMGTNVKMYIRINEVPFRIHISDDDVRDMKLSLGASIDVAFWENNPTLPKVLWEHRDM